MLLERISYFGALLIWASAGYALILPRGQMLICPLGQAISHVWYQDVEKGLREYAIECASITENCTERCIWTSICNKTIFGNSCYVRGLQTRSDHSNGSQRKLFLCCNGTASIRLCSNDFRNPVSKLNARKFRRARSNGGGKAEKSSLSPGDAPCDTQKLPCKLQVHPVKESITVNPTVARQADLDGLSALPGIAITKQAPITPHVIRPCEDTECSEEEENEIYKRFEDKFPGREVMSEHQSREQFKDNLDKLYGLREECTLTEQDATFTVGKFGDMSLDQMIKYMGGVIPEGGQLEYKVKPRYMRTWLRYRALDWRSLNVVPAVRYQGLCGSCYAFTVSELIAIQANIDRKQVVPDGRGSAYSAQYILDCFQQPQALGCTGGRPVSLLKYITECGERCSLPMEDCYRYSSNSTVNLCDLKKCKATKTGKVNWTAFLRLPQAEKETMANLLRWGPALTMIEISPAIQMYNQGIIRAYHCGTRTNHAVMIVGYNYTGDVPYYIVKNSWGTNWGENGYAKIEAGVNACGIANGVIFACVDNNCDKIQSPDDLVKRPNAPK